MGVRCSIIEVVADTFEQLVHNPTNKDIDLCSGESYFIDKDWDVIDDLLHDKAWPLWVAMTGDYRYPDWDYSLEDFRAGECDVYAGIASPELVREVAVALTSLPPSLVEQWYRDAGTDNWHEIEYLTEIYHQAAERGNGLSITIT